MRTAQQIGSAEREQDIARARLARVSAQVRAAAEPTPAGAPPDAATLGYGMETSTAVEAWPAAAAALLAMGGAWYLGQPPIVVVAAGVVGGAVGYKLAPMTEVVP